MIETKMKIIRFAPRMTAAGFTFQTTPLKPTLFARYAKLPASRSLPNNIPKATPKIPQTGAANKAIRNPVARQQTVTATSCLPDDIAMTKYSHPVET
ncbi:hypothetical protein MACH10_31190 [Thalassospira tepidiphila]|nr:hypothetical protein MACH10_31190 [Thalassospira tepidiphila]